MKTIVVHPFSSADAGMFDEAASEASAAPWTYLKYALSRHGISLQTSYRYQGALEDAKWLVFMNVPADAETRLSVKARLRRLIKGTAQDDFFRRCLAGGLQQKMAVMLWEPEVVYPLNYQPDIHKKFARIFTWMDALVHQGGPYRPIVWPQPPLASPPLATPFEQRKLLCNFSGNKKSLQPNELYSKRVEVIRYMEAHHPAQFEHYGPGWSDDFPSWRGTVDSKQEVYPGYRFGLCYENMCGVNGYVTEKIFDCLRAGCVPVYWGAPDIDAVVDRAAYVDRREFPDTAALIAHLMTMSQQQWEAMRAAGGSYLRSARFSRFLPPSFASMFFEGLFDVRH